MYFNLTPSVYTDSEAEAVGVARDSLPDLYPSYRPVETKLLWEKYPTMCALMADPGDVSIGMEADAARPSSATGRSFTPPPPDMPCPTAENWCYTQVSGSLQVTSIYVCMTKGLKWRSNSIY